MKLYKQRILSDGQLKRLGDHKYSCQSNSICDSLLQPWWNWLVAHTPIWLAPNLITVIGLFVNIVTTLILIWYSPDAKGDPPHWLFALCAFGLFAYQSLDAIDGKQARRTGTASPLGELFDHGCDSLSTIFVAISACIAVQLGHNPEWMFFQCFCAITLFYCAHWQTYVSGTLRFGKIDVTEAQYTIITIHLISAFFGPNIWRTTIPGLKMDLQLLMAYFACLVAVKLAYANFVVIFSGGAGKNGSTVAGTSVLSPVIPIATVLLPAFIIYKKSTESVYENYPALYILAFGFVAAKITNRLVVAHMTKSEMDYTDWSLLGPAMLFLNQYFNTFIPEYYVLWLCMIYVTFDLLRYCYQVCNEICRYLNVELFRIPYPGGPSRPSGPTPSTSTSTSSDKNGTSTSRVIKTRSRSKYH